MRTTDRITLSRFVKRPHVAFTLLSGTLLALSVAIAFLKPCSITPLFPYVALGATLLTVRFRTVGISIAYGALAFYLIYYYPSIDPEMRMWQMGAIFTLALTTFIFLLSFEEAEAHVTTMEKELEEKGGKFSAITEQLTQLEEDFKEKREAFEAEISRMKEEAEARLVERTQDKEHLELLTSEIELLTNQKNEILSKKHVSVEHAEPSQDLRRMEGLYKQLRQQFDEKAKVLLTARRELFAVEGELEATRRQKEIDDLNCTEGLEKDLVALTHENIALEDEVAALEELVSKLLG